MTVLYEVAPEGGGKSCVLHRNLLLPCDSLPLDKHETDLKQKETRHRKPTAQKTRNPTRREAESSDSKSSDDTELVCQFLLLQPQCQGTVSLNPNAKPFVPEMELGEIQPGQVDVETDTAPEDDQDDYTAGPEENPLELSERFASEEDEPEPQPVIAYPQGERRRRRMLTYGSLGEPTVVEVGVKSLQVSMFPAGKGLWRPWITFDIAVTS